jgi:formate-dependent phosphoribosylglycinamide formyltransferase (GAR transformylase)
MAVALATADDVETARAGARRIAAAMSVQQRTT